MQIVTWREMFGDQLVGEIAVLEEAIKQGRWMLVAAALGSLKHMLAMLEETAEEGD